MAVVRWCGSVGLWSPLVDVAAHTPTQASVVGGW